MYAFVGMGVRAHACFVPCRASRCSVRPCTCLESECTHSPAWESGLTHASCHAVRAAARRDRALAWNRNVRNRRHGSQGSRMHRAMPCEPLLGATVHLPGTGMYAIAGMGVRAHACIVPCRASRCPRRPRSCPGIGMRALASNGSHGSSMFHGSTAASCCSRRSRSCGVLTLRNMSRLSEKSADTVRRVAYQVSILRSPVPRKASR